VTQIPTLSSAIWPGPPAGTALDAVRPALNRAGVRFAPGRAS